MVRKIVIVAAMALLVMWPGTATAGLISCPTTGAYNPQRDFTLTTPVTGWCIAWGPGNVDNTWTGIDNPWLLLDKSDDGTSGLLQGSLAGSFGGTSGSFSVSPTAWSNYGYLALALKSGGTNAADPDWVVFGLPTNTTSGTWAISGQQGLSHANLYGYGAASPVPEPASMVLLGTGLVGLAYKVRRRK